MDEKNENKLIFLYFCVFYLELQLDSVKSNLKGSVNYYIIFLMVAVACSMVKTYYNVQDYYLAAIHVQRLVNKYWKHEYEYRRETLSQYYIGVGRYRWETGGCLLPGLSKLPAAL